MVETLSQEEFDIIKNSESREEAEQEIINRRIEQRVKEKQEEYKFIQLYADNLAGKYAVCKFSHTTFIGYFQEFDENVQENKLANVNIIYPNVIESDAYENYYSLSGATYETKTLGKFYKNGEISLLNDTEETEIKNMIGTFDSIIQKYH